MRPAWTPRHQVAAGAVTPVGPHDAAVTVAPPPGRELTSRRPPTSSARSVMLRSPYDPPRPPVRAGLGGEPAAAVVDTRRNACPPSLGSLTCTPPACAVLDNVLQRLPGGAV